MSKDDGWTTLGELRPGTLFELFGGKKFGVIHTDRRIPHSYVPVCLIRDNHLHPIGLEKDLKAREIDLPFLLLVAADRLEENQAYHRGHLAAREDLMKTKAENVGLQTALQAIVKLCTKAWDLPSFHLAVLEIAEFALRPVDEETQP